MLTVITGGSGSGKSEYAENIAVELYRNLSAAGLVYIATMKPNGSEALKRIERHQKLRSDKGFETVECYSSLKGIKIKNGCVVLLECMSNLVANEIFDEGNKNAVCDIADGIKLLCNISCAVVVVTNEVFSDGINYDDETVEYIKDLGEINCRMAEMADSVREVVCGIPIRIKGGERNAF